MTGTLVAVAAFWLLVLANSESMSGVEVVLGAFVVAAATAVAFGAQASRRAGRRDDDPASAADAILSALTSVSRSVGEMKMMLGRSGVLPEATRDVLTETQKLRISVVALRRRRRAARAFGACAAILMLCAAASVALWTVGERSLSAGLAVWASSLGVGARNAYADWRGAWWVAALEISAFSAVDDAWFRGQAGS